MAWLYATLAYVIPTFPLGYFWHLTFFKEKYRDLAVYRDEVSPAMGLGSMVVQGIGFGWIYVNAILPLQGGWLAHMALYLLLGGGISWSFTTLAGAAKSRMTSVRDFFVIETAFTLVQWVIVALCTVLLVG